MVKSIYDSTIVYSMNSNKFYMNMSSKTLHMELYNMMKYSSM